MTAVPVVSYLSLTGDEPRLTGWECCHCGAVFLDRRIACPRCTASEFAARRLAKTGVLRAVTVVHRAPPSVPTPFVAAIVDLDGGGVVKANVVGLDAETRPRCGQRVRMTTYSLGTDSEGTEAIGFGFEVEDQED